MLLAEVVRASASSVLRFLSILRISSYVGSLRACPSAEISTSGTHSMGGPLARGAVEIRRRRLGSAGVCARSRAAPWRLPTAKEVVFALAIFLFFWKGSSFTKRGAVSVCEKGSGVVAREAGVAAPEAVSFDPLDGLGAGAPNIAANCPRAATIWGSALI